MSHVLLSLCNVQLRRAPMLALLDLDTSDVRTVTLPEALANSQGVTGLALSEAFLFVAVPIVEGCRIERPAGAFVALRLRSP